MRCVRDEKLMSIKHTRHNPITFIKGRPICGATACKGNRLEFLRYVSESICIQMCNAEPQQSAWLIKLALMVSAGKCCASNKAPLLQSRAAVRGNSRPAGRRISSCSSRGRLGGQSCQEKGWAVISPCFSVPLPFSLFTSTFPAETLIFFSHPFAHPMSWFIWVLTLELRFYQHFGIVQLEPCIRMYLHKPVLHLNLRLHSPPSRVESCCLRCTLFTLPAV